MCTLEVFATGSKICYAHAARTLHSEVGEKTQSTGMQAIHDTREDIFGLHPLCAMLWNCSFGMQ